MRDNPSENWSSKNKPWDGFNILRRGTHRSDIMCVDTARPWPEIPGTDSALTWPNTLSSCLQTLKPYVCLYLSLHLCSSWSIWRGKLWGYGNVKWRKCDGWQWYDFNDCVPSNIFVYTRNTSRIVRIVSVLGYQAFSGLRWQCLDEAPCLTVVNISLIGVTMPHVCWLLSRTIYDTCGSCGCVMTMSPGDSVADTSGPVDNGRGSHRDWSARSLFIIQH